MNDLKDKVALITGGGRRIGACTARMLHASGMNLLIHYRNSSDEAESLRAELCEKRSDSVALIRGDLAKLAELSDLIDQGVKKFGRLDALINNASIFPATPVHSANEEQWQLVMDTNLKAPFFLSQAAAEHLKKTKGAIINIADLYADRPLAEHSIYCASKAGLCSLTKSLAIELAPQIRVNAIAPGAILWPENDTGESMHKRLVAQTPLKRKGDAEDIASTVKFLIMEAGFITGQVICVDGGRGITWSE